MHHSASCSASQCCSRSSRAARAATTPTGSSSATRCARGRRSDRSASCSSPTPRCRPPSMLLASTPASTSSAPWPTWAAPSTRSTGWRPRRCRPRRRPIPRIAMGKPGALPHLYSGKVRELYEVAYDQLLVVASDRVSVFDVVLPDEIPDKGRVLTGVSQFWFDHTAGIVPNHVISCDPTDFPPTAGAVGGRAMLVRTTHPIRLECVARGYLFGSAWSEYQDRGTVGGVAAPAGLRQADKLPKPLFTPTTKADGGHDLPLTE